MYMCSYWQKCVAVNDSTTYNVQNNRLWVGDGLDTRVKYDSALGIQYIL